MKNYVKVYSFCTIFIFWKQGPFTKPFQAYPSWHQVKDLVFIKWKTLFQKWMDLNNIAILSTKSFTLLVSSIIKLRNCAPQYFIACNACIKSFWLKGFYGTHVGIIPLSSEGISKEHNNLFFFSNWRLL